MVGSGVQGAGGESVDALLPLKKEKEIYTHMQCELV